MSTESLTLDGKAYVVVPRAEFERLATMAKAMELPAMPAPDAKGNYPAVEYLRASIARDIIRQRAEVGLNQRELAELAGVRVETLCRIETGVNTPSVATIDRIDRALQRARKGKR
jgi:DNA-binding XRE family transcriptional regulator